MQIYNTLKRKKEEFEPQNPPHVKMYVCGPTVYDYFHIGNARSFLMADVIHRYLEYREYDVKYVMNLTDVDDKIIKKANNEGVKPKDITDKFTKAFFDDLSELGVKKADVYPKATEHIGDIISLIKKIEENNTAYNVDGDVFYDVSSFNGYGKLSGKNIEELESGARIEINKAKKNPLDFSLWKKAKEGEPSWESPWGGGRPGWHIECSAMSTKHLGETIDIHAGGTDLVFPHHENEIAQSEAATHKDFVKYWIHFGFLNIDNEKMSKSTGNFFTARDILKKYSAEVIRLFLNQTHYRSPLNFSEDALIANKKGFEKIANFAESLLEGIENKSLAAGGDFDTDRYRMAFEQAMDDDFNTPKATALIFDFMRDFNKYVTSGEAGREDYNEAKKFVEDTAQEVLGIINFEKLGGGESKSLEKELVNLLIDLRLKAKKDKNFSLADEIRDRLTEIGVVLRDTKDGTTYKIQ